MNSKMIELRIINYIFITYILFKHAFLSTSTTLYHFYTGMCRNQNLEIYVYRLFFYF